MLSLLPFLPDSFRHTLSRSSTASIPTFNSPRSGLFYAFVEPNLSPLLHGPPDFTGRYGSRELHGGRLPVVGAQIMRGKPSDIIRADLFRAEKDVWLIRRKNALQPGQYALMIAGALLPNSACRSALSVPLRSVIFPLLRLLSPALFFFHSALVANLSASFLYTKSLWSFVCEGAACPLRS